MRGEMMCALVGALVGDAANTTDYAMHGHVGFVHLPLSAGRILIVLSFLRSWMAFLSSLEMLRLMGFLLLWIPDTLALTSLASPSSKLSQWHL